MNDLSNDLSQSGDYDIGSRVGLPDYTFRFPGCRNKGIELMGSGFLNRLQVTLQEISLHPV